MRRTAVIPALVAVVLAATGALAAAGGAQQPPGQTIKLVTKGGTFKFVDAPPRARGERGPGAGDQSMLSQPVFDAAATRRIGTLDAHCAHTKGGRGLRGLCNVVYALGDGDLYVMARLSRSDDVFGAVVGGTGAYAGARGTFKSIARSGRSEANDDTLTLLP